MSIPCAGVRVIKIALAQMSGRRSKEENLENIISKLQQAARLGASVVCFPELCTTTNFLFERSRVHFALAEALGGPTNKRVHALARELGLSVLLPFFERSDGDYFDSVAMIDGKRGVFDRYRACSLPEGGPGRFAMSGTFYFKNSEEGYRVIEFDSKLKFGVLVCYERHYPEAVRALALGGAAIIFIPSNSYAAGSRASMWEIELRAHAYQNGVYIAVPNRVGLDEGREPGTEFRGESLLIDPRGEVVARGSTDREEMLIGEVDEAAMMDHNARSPFFSQRTDEMSLKCERGGRMKPNEAYPRNVFDLLRGGVLSQVIATAAKLRLADHLANGPLNVEQLAARAEYEVDATYRIVRVLAKFKLFDLRGRVVSLGELGPQLSSTTKGSLREWAILLGSKQYWSALGNLDKHLPVRGSCIENEWGRSIFELAKSDAAFSQIYNKAMGGIIDNEAREIAASYDFSRCVRFTDVAGGLGSVTAALLRRHPHLRATIFDLPNVIEKCERAFDPSLKQRCDFASGDFMQSIPPGSDTFILCRILHDWDDKDAMKILRCCRNSMNPGQRLLVVDRMIETRDVHPDKVLADINVKVLYGGKERDRQQFAQILSESGFDVVGVRQLTVRALIEAQAI